MELIAELLINISISTLNQVDKVSFHYVNANSISISDYTYDQNGKSALHYAIESLHGENQLSIVKALCEAGIDVNIATKKVILSYFKHENKITFDRKGTQYCVTLCCTGSQ